jgi:hypothetical protein
MMFRIAKRVANKFDFTKEFPNPMGEDFTSEHFDNFPQLQARKRELLFEGWKPGEFRKDGWWSIKLKGNEKSVSFKKGDNIITLNYP